MLESLTFKVPNYCPKPAISKKGICITPGKYFNNTEF